MAGACTAQGEVAVNIHLALSICLNYAVYIIL